MMEHKKEPWKVGAWESGQFAIDSADGKEVTGFIDEADARRIIACVNACAELPTEELEAYKGYQISSGLQLIVMKQQRDELLTALESARNRMADMLQGDDGQAWKEAQKAMPSIEATIASAKGKP